MAAKPFPILFIAGASLEEAITSSGLIRKINEEAPGARFTIATGEAAAALYAATPNVEAIVRLEAKPDAREWIAFWRRALDRRWGLVVDLRGSGVGWWLRRRRRATAHPGHADPPIHKVIEAAAALGLEDDPPAPWVYVDGRIEAAAEAVLGDQRPILAIAPGGPWTGKTWPAERFAQVVAQLLSPDGLMEDARLMVVGGPEDVDAGRAVKLATSFDRLVSEPGDLTLLQTYAALKHVRLFIGNDGPFMHLAAAAGAPTLGLFGPTDERVWAPWGAHARPLRGPRTPAEILKTDPEMNQAICHMLDLSVGAVTEAARRLLNETEPAGG
jgi:ADP-heptose:LPS heptosyltransferase